MKLQTLSRLAGTKGLVRGWRAGLLPLALLVTGLSSRVEAASYYPTTGIDLKQFSPSKELNKFWMFMDSTITTSSGSFSTADHGYVGAGSWLSISGASEFKTKTMIRGSITGGFAGNFYDTVLTNSDFSLPQGKISNKGIFQVAGNASLGGQGGTDSAKTWVGGNSVFANNFTFTNDYYSKGTADFSVNNITNTGVLHMAGDASTVLTSSNIRGTVSYSQPFSPPVSFPTLYTASQLPGYNVPGLDAATVSSKGALTSLSSVIDINAVCAVTACDSIGARTINGVFMPAGKILPPGYYGDVTFDNQILYVGEGVYYFNKASFSNSNAKLVAIQKNAGRTIVYADKGFQTSAGGVFVGPDSAVGATGYGSGPGLFLGGTMMVVAGPNSNVKIDSDTRIWATLSAPTGRIEMNSQVRLYGQMFGRHFNGANQFSGGLGDFVPFDPEKPQITISISPSGTQVPEADTTYIAKVSIPTKNAYAVSFNYATSISVKTSDGKILTGTAVPNVNYVDQSTPAIAVIKAGETSVDIPFTIKWDHVYTGNLTFYLDFTNPAGGVFAFNPASGVVGDTSHVAALITILDKDHAPTLRISDVSAKEGNSGTTDFKFVVSFADSATGGAYVGTVNRDINYTWSTVAGTASSASGDYGAMTKVAGTIVKGKTTDTIVVKVNGDLKYELDEVFTVVIDSASLVGQAAIADAAMKKLVGIGTIVNDDNFPKLMIDSTGFKEGDADSVRKLVVYLVDPVTKAKLDGTSAPEVPVKYSWSTSDNTAGHSLTGTIPDTDYVEVPSSARSIAANKWTDTIQVTTKGDARFEANETFRITLVPGDSAWKKDGNTVALDTIRNDDNQPIVKVRDSSVVEGNSGITKLYFKVGLYNQGTGLPITKADAPTTDVTFDWKTIAGSATDAGTKDFLAVTAGKGTIVAGSVDTTLSVDVVGDKRYELNEQFTVAITHLTNAALYPLNDTVATMTIVNDDSLPRLKIVSDSSRHEGDVGDRNLATFTLSLTDIAGIALPVADGPEIPVAFRWQTTDGTAKSSGTEIADTDYVAVLSRADTIQVGAVSKTLEVQVKGDKVDEDNETFTVSVNAVSGASTTAGALNATGTIIDDDAPPSLLLSGVRKAEGNQGSVTNDTFSVALSSPSAILVTFHWFTRDSTAKVGDNDYQSVSRWDTIKVGATKPTRLIIVPVTGDNKLEPDEYFSIKVDTLKGATFASGKDTAVATILNDDALPFIQVKSLGNVKEGNAGDTALYFEVNLVDSTGAPATPSALAVTYNWSTVDSVDNVNWKGASSTDNDFVKVTNAARSIPAGKIKDTLRVVVKGDAKYEYDESFRVVLNGVTGADTNGVVANAKDKGITTAVGTILNDDGMPSLTATGDTVQEPAKTTDADAALVLGLHLSAISGVPVTVHFQTSGGIATPDNGANKYDYRDTTGSVTFNPGDTVKTVLVKVHGDDIYEGTTPETVNFTVTSTSNATVATGSAIGYIRDNDDAPILHIDTVQASEGGQLVFTASLRDKAGNAITSGLPVSFTWKTVDGTATAAGLDYTAASKKDSIPAGTNSVQITVTTLADNIANEGTETLFIQPVSVAAVVNAVIGDTGLGKILDVTPKPNVSIKDAVVSEAAGHAVFVITLDRPSATDLKLTWNTAADADKPVSLQARASGSDPNYTAKTNVSVIFPKNTVTDTVWVPINDNSLDEPDTLWYWSVLKKTIAGDTTFAFKDSLAVGGILDNDGPPTISINDVSVQEPKDASSAKGYAKFTISLSAKSAQDISVSWKTVDSTAKHDSDFVAKSGTALIKAGSLSVVDSIQILPDTLWELDEHFKISLFSPVNAKFSDSLGVITIRDNDVAPAVRIDDAEITEPNQPDSSLITFKVRLSHVSGRTVVFKWETADNFDVTAGNQAVGDADYRVVAPTTVTMLPGDSVASLKVWVLSDNISDQKEKFKILLSKAVAGDTNLTFADSVGVGAIYDANGRPFVSINDTSMVEANAPMTFRLKLTNPSSTDVLVHVHSVDQTATASSDYKKLPASGVDTVITIKAGKDTATFHVRILDDLLHENTETFKLVIDSTDTLTDGSMLPSANIGGVGYGIGTIVDNDSAPKVSVIDSLLQEPAVAGASAMMKFRIHLSAPSELPVSVAWSTLDSTAQTKIAPYDYVDTGSSITLRPGLVDTTISVRILGDSLYEGSESFKLNLLTVTNGSFADSSAVGTILDNDVAPRISVDDQTVREGDTAHFTVRLERESGLPTTFDWNTLDGTAKVALKDYKDTLGSITIPAGQLTATLAVRALTDNVSGEGPETFRVVLSNIQGATKLKDTGVGTILDTNALPGLVIDSVLKVWEKDIVVTFTVHVVGAPSAVPLHIRFATHEGTAKAGLRYADTSGTLVLPALATAGTIAVHILDDSIREPQEEFYTLVLDQADSATLLRPIGLGSVIDSGDYPTLHIANSDTVYEGDAAIFPLTLSNVSKDTIRVGWHTNDDPDAKIGARAGKDYTATSGVVIFLPGRKTASLSVGTLTDNVWEPTELFHVVIDSVRGVLDGAKAATVAEPSATGWIKDVGEVPTVTYLSPDSSVHESHADSIPVRLGLSRPASVDITVNIPSPTGTATFGSVNKWPTDYTVSGYDPSTGALTFKAGDTVTSFAVRVTKDSVDEYDETANFGLLTSQPIRIGVKGSYALTILDDDSAPTVRFDTSYQEITEGDSVVVRAHLSRPSGKNAEAWYRSNGTASAGVDDDRVPGAHLMFYFKAGDTTAFVKVHTVDDNIHEGQENMVFRIDSVVNLTLDPLHQVDSVVVVDNDDLPFISFVVADTTVREDVGTVTLGLRLSNPSSTAITVLIDAKAGTATLDSLARASDVELQDSARVKPRYSLVIPAGDTLANFTFKVLDDGRVEPTENFSLKVSSKDAKPRDPVSLVVNILDNDLLPVVKITSPAEGAHLGKKDLNSSGKVPATWTVNKLAMTPFDTLLPEGPSTISKCYTDDWGNTGCDSVHVTLDTTPPTVVIDSICKGNGVCVPAGPTMPWVNEPDVIVKWHVVDGTVITKHSDKEHLIDSVNTPVRCAEDAVGNKGCGSSKVGLDTVPPTVNILTPPPGSHWAPGCLNVTYTSQDNDVITHHDTLQCFATIGKHTYTVCSEADRAGNVGCDSSTVYIDPMVPSSATYLDTDGDGRIDQVVVNFPAKWVGELPTADISYGAPGTNTIKGVTASYGASSQAGNILVVGKDTLKDASGKPIRVVPGVAVLDAKGQQVVDANGVPVYQSSLGTPLLDAKGVQRLDSNGVPLWSVSSSSSSVDSSVLVFKLTTPYPYGWTSSSVKDLGLLHAVSLVQDSTGAIVKQPYTATFNIADGVPPVILHSEVVRTEDYNGKDRTTVYPSEPLQFSKTKGTGIVQISTDGGLSWHDVVVDSLTPSGAIVILTDPGTPGSPKPNVLIRLVDAVSDMKGNVATTGHQPSVVITGGPRPDLVQVKEPNGVLEIGADNANKNLKGGFTFLTSRKDTTNLTAYRPGEGYGTSAETQEVCPDISQCSVTRVYINRPASVQMYVYDHLGTYIAKTNFTVTKKDMELMETDKLDRVRLDVVWNLRNDQGRQVVSGVYLIRMIIRYNDASTSNAPLENFVLKMGVHIND